MEYISIQVGILTIVTLLNIILSLFVYYNNPKSATNIIFGILGFLISIWLIVLYFSQSPTFINLALTATRMAIFIAAPMSMAFYFLAYTLPNSIMSMDKKWFIFYSIATAVTMAINLSPFAFTHIEIANNAARPVAGPGMLPFSILSTYFSVAAVYILVRKYRHSTGFEKNQYKFVMIGILLMLSLIITTIMIPVMIFKNDALVPFAPLYTFIFLGLTAYAIIKHRFLEIRSILSRAVSFLIFIVLFSAVYALILFIIVEKILSIRIDVYVAFIALIMTISGSLFFQPVMAVIQKITNRFFFKGQYDRNELTASLTHIMAQTIDLDDLAKSLLKLLTSQMRLTKGAFLIIDKHGISKTIAVGFKEKDLFEPALESMLMHHRGTEKEFIFEELQKGPLKKTFRRLDIEYAMPIGVEKNEVAILLLGPKLSGEIYSSQDIEFLNIFAAEAGIAIQNAKSYEAIKQFSKILERRVEERTAELKTTQEHELAKAQELARLKDEFVFIAAHELRTPVTAIRGFLDLMDDSVKHLPAAEKENFKFISAASTHLSTLVNDLLEISRAEGGTMKIAVRPTEIIPLAKEVVTEVKPLADEKKIKISFKISGTITPILADGAKIKEVIMNLISNAIKYNRESGNVEINIYPIETLIMFEVHDTGYGIPADQQDKIFRKFFRAANPATEEVLGTGLGLFITKMLVEKMGGKITFSSIEGHGSTFAVTMPQAI